MNQFISIIVPCFNQGQYLDKCLQSVLDQNHENWECIIVNDGSPDNAEKIAQEWILKDSRFIYLYKENGGVSSARNLGLDKSKGEYIQFLDADDFIDKRKLEMSLECIMNVDNIGVNVVVSDFRMFTITPEESTNPFCRLNSQLITFESLVYEWNESFSIPIHCGFFDASFFKTIRFPEKLNAQEDWIVWISIFYTGGKAIFIDKPLAFYRINPSSRMNTIGLGDDQLKAVEYLMGYLPDEIFKKLALVLISRYYNLSENLKYKIKLTTNSDTYQIGSFVKRVLKKIRIYKPLKKKLKYYYKIK